MSFIAGYLTASLCPPPKEAHDALGAAIVFCAVMMLASMPSAWVWDYLMIPCIEIIHAIVDVMVRLALPIMPILLG